MGNEQRAPLPGKARRVNQIQLIAAISEHLSKEQGIIEGSARHMDAIIRAADLIVAEFGRDDVVAASGAGLQAWIRSDRVGSSSLFMARTLAPLAGLGDCPHHHYRHEIAYPHDPDDLSRCLHLLDVVPELGKHLEKLSKTHPVWAAYVTNWEEMVRLFKEEAPKQRAPKLYALMKRLEKEAFGK